MGEWAVVGLAALVAAAASVAIGVLEGALRAGVRRRRIREFAYRRNVLAGCGHVTAEPAGGVHPLRCAMCAPGLEGPRGEPLHLTRRRL